MSGKNPRIDIDNDTLTTDTEHGKEHDNTLSDKEVMKAEVIKYNRETYGQKLLKWRTARGLSQLKLANILGVRMTYIGHWENGRARPDMNMVPKICDALQITTDEFFGRVEKYSFEEQLLIRKYRELSLSEKKILQSLLDAMKEYRNEGIDEKPLYTYIKLLRNDQPVCAGVFNPLDSDECGEYVTVKKNNLTERADEIITVCGDSMEPTYHDGDELLVQHTDHVDIGEIGIFVINGEGFVKELRRNGVYSHNAGKYPFRRFVDGDDVRCVGRVIGVLDKEDYK